MKSMGTQLLFGNNAYHPQTDGQSERPNQCLENYLRCMCFLIPKQWARKLSLAEYWYNTSHHSSINMSPFQALYGIKPTLPVLPGAFTTVAAVEEMLRLREEMNLALKEKLSKAQKRMKQLADNGRSDRQFKEGVGCSSKSSTTDSTPWLLGETINFLLSTMDLIKCWLK